MERDRELRFEGDSEIVSIREFDPDTAVEFREEVFARFQENPRKPIIIEITSYGGSVDAALSMIDVMDSVSSMAPESFYFVTVASGMAMSAGALLLSNGDYRFCTPNSRVMLHQANKFFYGGSVVDLDIEHSEFLRLNNSVLTILADNCKIKGGYKTLSKMIERDTYLTAEESREFGVIDVVGYPKLNELRFYELEVANGVVPPENEKPETRRKSERVKKTTKVSRKKNSKS